MSELGCAQTEIKKLAETFFFLQEASPYLFPQAPNTLLGPFVNPAPPMKPPPHRRPPASSLLKKFQCKPKKSIPLLLTSFKPAVICRAQGGPGSHQAWFSSTQNKKKGKMTGISKRLHCSFLTNCTINKNMRAKARSPLGLAQGAFRDVIVSGVHERESRFPFIDSVTRYLSSAVVHPSPIITTAKLSCPN